jgi:hypothetical protein
MVIIPMGLLTYKIKALQVSYLQGFYAFVMEQLRNHFMAPFPPCGFRRLLIAFESYRYNPYLDHK